MKHVINCFLLLASYTLLAQTDTAAKKSILLVPFQQMMYFSDADQDIARFSKTTPDNVRATLRNEIDVNIYHQLLAYFNVISLLRSATLNGEYDLNKIYAATRYTLLRNSEQEHYNKSTGLVLSEKLKSITKGFQKQKKDQLFWTNDSIVMLADIGDRELFPAMSRKYNCNYILFITQFEINTNNKNTLEWLKQEYTREFMIHFNLFDNSGKLIRAETLTIKANNDNKLADIKSNHIILLAQKLRDIIKTIHE